MWMMLHLSIVSLVQLKILRACLPIPKPLMSRPTIICGSWKLAICNTAPTQLQVTPTNIVLFRPSLSPKAKANRHPTKAPSYVT